MLENVRDCYKTLTLETHLPYIPYVSCYNTMLTYSNENLPQHGLYSIATVAMALFFLTALS